MTLVIRKFPLGEGRKEAGRSIELSDGIEEVVANC